MQRTKFAVGLAALITGCVTFPTPESEQVKVIWDNNDFIQQCEQKATVFGSEGHFYDFWLHADKDMLWGAINQMRIKAAALGGNVLYLYPSLNFSSSVTLMGNVYVCNTVPYQDNTLINVKIE